MLIVAIICLVLSALLMLGQWASLIAASRRGEGYSCVPLISLLFGVAAFLLGRPTLGWWALLPAMLDPGTWVCVALPWVFWQITTEKRRRE